VPVGVLQVYLYLDVSLRTGAIKVNFPDLEVWELEESCVLDLADTGGLILERVGSIMNLTRERVRQLEAKALARLERSKEVRELRELYRGEGEGSRIARPTPCAWNSDGW
jgi:hypothetical protein